MKAVTIEIDVKSDLSSVSKSIWRHIKSFELNISNKEGKKIGFPAVYGVAIASMFPMLTLATLYSLASADLRISVEKGN